MSIRRVARNLYLRTRPPGAASYLFRFNLHGRAHCIGLGSVELVPLADAKRRALELRLILANGGDPRRPQRPKRAATFAEAAAEYVREFSASWSDQHKGQWVQSIALHAKALQSIPVDKIGVDDVLVVLRPIWTAKHVTAGRLRARIEKVLSFATARGWRDAENPAALERLRYLLPAASGDVQHMAAMPWQDVPRFMAELPDNEPARALRFAIVTACRSAEVLAAHWSEIDLRANVWTIPAARMKMKRPHRVPLAESVIQIIFPTFGGDRLFYLGENAMRTELQRLHSRLTVHGFRSSFRDWAAEQGFPDALAELALAHSRTNKTEAAYLRTDRLNERRALMEAWVEHCMGRKSTLATRELSARR